MRQNQSLPEELLRQFNRIYTIPPNDLHVSFLTGWYKRLTSPLKGIPLIYIIPLSLFMVGALYWVLRGGVIRLTTLLQYGF